MARARSGGLQAIDTRRGVRLALRAAARPRRLLGGHYRLGARALTEHDRARTESILRTRLLALGMHESTFANLPVEDLKRSVTFFTNLDPKAAPPHGEA